DRRQRVVDAWLLARQPLIGLWLLARQSVVRLWRLAAAPTTALARQALVGIDRLVDRVAGNAGLDRIRGDYDRVLDERRQRIVRDRRNVDRVRRHARSDAVRRDHDRMRGKWRQALVGPLTSATATRWRLRLRQGVIGALAPAHTRTVATTKRRDQ